MEYNIALTGNPNVGKTSLYNRITHSLEHVGNWHGVTVSKVSKKVLYDHHTVNMVDLPGLYSMSIYSYEESITRDSVLNDPNDLIINVCEVNNLSRNLYLTLQLLELNKPVVLVVNMMDELKKQGKVLNYRKIETFLKIPIVPMSAKYHSDVHLLMDVSLDYIKNYKNNTVALTYLDKLPIKDVESIISANAVNAGFSPKWAAIKILENDTFVYEKLNLNEAQVAALRRFGDLQAEVAKARYKFIEEITDGAISRPVVEEHHEMHEHMMHNVPLDSDIKESELMKGDIQDKHIKHHNKHKEYAELYKHGFSKLDKVVLNKYLALPIFFILMALVFVVTFGLLGKLFSWLLNLGIENGIYAPLVGWLNRIECPAWIIGLVGDGIILGVGGILTFLPQVVLLFFFLALLEDSGYISRVAFMTDGIFRKIGLSGRSAFTMLMGFGCSATAVLTARGLEDEKMRKKTVLLTPFMSCSARLPVYAIIAGAVFSGGQPLIIFGLYLLGIAVALIFAAILEKTKIMKSGKLSFIMEMPPYRLPTFERVIQIIWNNVKVFIVRVGTVIFALNVIVWLLSNFSFMKGFVGDSGSDSIMGLICGFIAPIFIPLGFGNWQATTSLVSGLIAKEVVISTLNSLTQGNVAIIFNGAYPQLAALCFLVFTLLYVPCIATLVAIGKEIGAKWAFISLAIQLFVAYIVALLFRGVGILFIKFTAVAVSVALIAVLAAVLTFIVIYLIRRKGKICNCASCDDGCPLKQKNKRPKK